MLPVVKREWHWVILVHQLERKKNLKNPRPVLRWAHLCVSASSHLTHTHHTTTQHASHKFLFRITLGGTNNRRRQPRNDSIWSNWFRMGARDGDRWIVFPSSFRVRASARMLVCVRFHVCVSLSVNVSTVIFWLSMWTSVCACVSKRWCVCTLRQHFICGSQVTRT